MDKMSTFSILRGKKFGVVGVGGTFDELHKGHRALLMKAFTTGDHVWIGLSTDELARKILKNHEVAPFRNRKKELTLLLKRKGLLDRVTITPLKDVYGPAASSRKLEAIVVSRETEPAAHRINAVRKLKRLPLLEVIVVDMVPADNHVSISSTRIRQGEIDREGHLLW